MRLLINGNDQKIARALIIRELLTNLNFADPDMVSVELDGSILRREIFLDRPVQMLYKVYQINRNGRIYLKLKNFNYKTAFFMRNYLMRAGICLMGICCRPGWGCWLI